MIALPSPRLAAGAVLAQTVLLNAMFVAGMVVLADADPFDGSARDFAVVGGIHLVNATLVIGLGLLVLGRRSLAEIGWAADPAPARSVGLGLAGAATCALVVASVGLGLGGAAGFVEMLGSFLAIPPEQRLLFAAIGLGAAFVEESVFRGTLQPALVARLGRPLGILVGAVIFSAYHLKVAPIGFVVKVVFGVIFGTLREATGGRLWAPALAHLGVWVAVGLS